MTAHGYGRRALGTVLDMPQDGTWVVLVTVERPSGRVREIEAQWQSWGENYRWLNRDGIPVMGTITAWRPIHPQRKTRTNQAARVEPLGISMGKDQFTPNDDSSQHQGLSRACGPEDK